MSGPKGSGAAWSQERERERGNERLSDEGRRRQ